MFEEADHNNQPKVISVEVKETGDKFEIKGRPCELSAFSFVPPSRKHETTQRSIYNYKANQQAQLTNYDQLYKLKYDFDNKIHRDDRQHAKLYGLDVEKEELTKVMPSKSSSEYGKRVINGPHNDNQASIGKYVIHYDPQDRKHARIATVKSEFYNRNGINDLNRLSN